MMKELTPAQVNYATSRINAAGAGHYTFVHGVATAGDAKFGVVVVWDNTGDLRAVTVETKKHPIWLTNEAQFADAVEDVVNRLKLPL